jgi:serine-type D-Ala-D-Ala carboxypeptidase
MTQPGKSICKMENVHPSVIYNFGQQDEQFSSAFSVLREAIAEHAFPAASVAVTYEGHLIALKAFGKFVYEEDIAAASPLSRPSRRSLPRASEANRRGGDVDVDPCPLFDLASVTKVVATTTMAAILFERGLLDLDGPVVGTIPEFRADSRGTLDPRRKDVTFRMLLAHSSGLPAYEKLFLKYPSRDELLHAALTTPLAADPGSRAEYSDIGFIILGTALECMAGESLDSFCQREIFGPLGMSHTTFNPSAELRLKIPPTADECECGADTHVRAVQNSDQLPGRSHAGTETRLRSTFRNRIIQGEVQDENAFMLGGVAGHAGLFSTAEDLALFAQAMQKDNPILRPETVALFTHRQSLPANTSPADASRALGWDTPSQPSQSGKYFGARSFGHLGYTGTSLWIDPDRELSITLLTNRTWPDCSNWAIKQVRPKFHDAVIEALRDR